jgi:hypothetical protein
MYTMKIFLLIFLLSVYFHDGVEYPFYDFTIIIDYQHLQYEDDYTFIFPNSPFYQGNLKRDHLSKIHYRYDGEGNRIAQDTLTIKVSESQIDTLFILTRDLFTIKYEENRSVHKIPPPPPPYHGMVVDITFDLGFWGDYYFITWRNNGSHSFVAFLVVLTQIVAPL